MLSVVGAVLVTQGLMVAPARAWFDTDWQYRRTLTVNAGQVCNSATLPSFPVLVDVSGLAPSYTNGDDFAFVAADDTTQLSHEIESYDDGTGRLIAWVEVLSVTDGTIFYLYYDNEFASNQEDVAGTWDGSDYRMVQHLHETSGTHVDSTGYGNNGTFTNGGSQNAAGQVDGADSFVTAGAAATGTTIDCGNAASLQLTGTSLTLSAWIRVTGGGVGDHFLTKAGSTRAWEIFYQTVSPTFGLGFRINHDGASLVTSPVSQNTWYYAVGTYDGANTRLYLNGAQVAISGAYSTAIQNTTNHLRISGRDNAGAGAPSAYTFNGLIDEARVSGDTKSANWICTEYKNQVAPATFMTVGSEQSQPAVCGNTIVETGEDCDPPGDCCSATCQFVAAATPCDDGAFCNGTDTCNGAGTCAHTGNPCSLLEICNEVDDVCDDLPPCFRRQIVIDADQVCGAAPLSDFPVLVDFTDAGMVGNVQPDGDDFLFTDALGVPLSHEIELYDNVSGHLVAWVKVPSVSNVDDTILYLNYGNPTVANQEDVAGTWDSAGADYRMVQHLSETTGTHIDSTGNGNDGTYFGSNQDAAGQIDGADGFVAATPTVAGSGESVDCGNGSTVQITGTSMTVSAWFNSTGQASPVHMVTKGTDGPRSYELFTEPNQPVTFRIGGSAGGAASSPTLSPNTWYHAVGTYDGSDVRVYINGVAVDTTPYATPIANVAASLKIAARHTSGGAGIHYFNGLMDEVRIAGAALGADWICTEYNNQAGLGFLTVGAAEACPNQPLVESAGPRYLGITPLPVNSTEPMRFHVTSPDFPCLSSYVVGPRRCGGIFDRCDTDADCNACSIAGDPCTAATEEQDCVIPGEFCIESGWECVPGSVMPFDINGDGFPDGTLGTLADVAPEDAPALTPAQWGAGLKRCSRSIGVCSVDEDCDHGTCIYPGCGPDNCDTPCDVSAQDCDRFCNLSFSGGCVIDADCPAGETCVDPVCERDEVCMPGKIYVTGPDIVPSTDLSGTVVPVTYNVQVVGLALPVPVEMKVWCDVNDDKVANFNDINMVLLAFQGWYARGNGVPSTLANVDMTGSIPCAPDQVPNFNDIQSMVFAFQGQDYPQRLTLGTCTNGLTCDVILQNCVDASTCVAGSNCQLPCAP